MTLHRHPAVFVDHPGPLAAFMRIAAATVRDPAPQLATVDVLVARADINLGQAVKPENLQWQSWPAGTASGLLIRRDTRPDAPSQLAGSIARAPFFTGEPIREQKLVK